MAPGFAETGPAGPAETERPGPLPPRLDAPPQTTSWAAPVPPVAPPPARRSARAGVLIAVLAVLVVAQATVLVVVERQLAAANRKLDAQAASTDRQLRDLTGRLHALEQQAAKTLDAQAVAQAVLPSVFKITVPDGTATAFALGGSGGGTDLITNYHVVESLWNAGQRTAEIDHDNQRFPVEVVQVDKDNDLALLHTIEKFPRIPVAGGTPVVGTPIVEIGAPAGYEQSVTSGVVSALRTDIPGEAGKTLIQFDAASNPGNSGSPLVNAQKQVIGVDQGTLASGSEGLHIAIPIAVACKSFSGLC